MKKQKSSSFDIFLVFLVLGLTSFGGPVAHIGYYREALVRRRGWLSEASFADLVAVAQFLPGPSSTQLSLAIGALRGGVAGALAAWLGFTLPSAALMIACGYGILALDSGTGGGWLAGLGLAALAVVANALLGMARALTPDLPRAAIAAAAAAMVIAVSGSVAQLAAITLGGVAGVILYRGATGAEAGAAATGLGRRLGAASLALFGLLLIGLPIAAEISGDPFLAVIDGVFRAGALVFGGGHVVLPLLESVVVPSGAVSPDAFVAGYGAAQALPGPLFTFAAYLGTVMTPQPAGWLGGLACLVAIFLPGILLLLGVMPFWSLVAGRARVRAAMRGVNAAVVGLLAAALYDPVWTSAVHRPLDAALALAGLVALARWRCPPWALVIVLALAGEVLSR